MSADVISWHEYKDIPVLQCHCGCQEFYFPVNRFGKGWDKIFSPRCVECGEVIKFVAGYDFTEQEDILEIDGAG